MSSPKEKHAPVSERQRVYRTVAVVTLLLITVVVFRPPVDVQDLIKFSNRPYQLSRDAVSRVHCVCGPAKEMTPNHGCQAVIENAITKVLADQRVELHLLAPNKTTFLNLARQVLHCVGEGGNTPRLYFDWNQLGMGRASDALREQCNNVGWVNELQWTVKWPFAVFYHFMYDRGVFQAWMFLRELKMTLGASWNIPVSFNLMDKSDWVTRHLTPAEQEIWDIMLPSVRTSVLTNETYCTKYTTFGYWWISPMTYRADFILPVALKASLTDFARELQRRVIEKHGDAKTDDRGITFVPRNVDDFYDSQQRSRGIQPVLRAKLQETFQRAYPGREEWTAAVEKMPQLKDQFFAIRRHRVLYSAEGSFFTSLVMAPANSTWVLVYNHTKSPTEWKHHGFHATIASALPFMRLVVFVVDNGAEPSQDELAAILMAPWKSGVFFVGADADGNRRAAQQLVPRSPGGKRT